MIHLRTYSGSRTMALVSGAGLLAITVFAAGTMSPVLLSWTDDRKRAANPVLN